VALRRLVAAGLLIGAVSVEASRLLAAIFTALTVLVVELVSLLHLRLLPASILWLGSSIHSSVT
jgi:hypothetical protein